jgi:protein NrfD
MQTAIKLLGVPAALAGMAMSTYTGALLSATSTPLWAAAPRRIAALFGASAMASGAATLTIAEQGHGALDTARPLDRITLVASALELFAAAALSRTRGGRRIERGASPTTLVRWRTAPGTPMLHHIERVVGPERAPRRALTVSLAVLAGGFLLRHVLLRAGNTSAKRPKDYFRLTGRVPQ